MFKVDPTPGPHVSCASCHPDARLDRLAWDLGNPAGGLVQSFHPMKGPMVTQTLQDIILEGDNPLHWRGDRNGIEDFNQLTKTSTNAIIAWQSVPGLIYDVQFKDNLSAAFWRMDFD